MTKKQYKAMEQRWRDRQQAPGERGWSRSRNVWIDQMRETLAAMQAGNRARQERLRREALERLDGPPVLPPELELVLEECGAEFTRPQVEALVYKYGYELSTRTAAKVLGCTHSAYRRRLRGAEDKLAHLRGDALRYERPRLYATTWSAEHRVDTIEPLIRRQRGVQLLVGRLGR